MKNPNVTNFACNRKKMNTTFETRPTICVSSTSEGKILGWAVTVGWRARKCVKANNTLPKKSLCHVPNSNKMTLRFPC
jgi:hypothetical protein